MNGVLASVKFIAAAVVIAIKAADSNSGGDDGGAHTHILTMATATVFRTYKSNVECYPSMSKNNTIHHCSTTAL